mgnify:FL=1
MPLPLWVFLALSAFAAALLGGGAGRAASLHLMLAVGAMPLIFAAMMHFIPVLTRSRAAPAGLAWAPLLALAGGVWVWGALGFPDRIGGRGMGAVPAVAGAIVLLLWSRRRRAAMLGQPHPGLAWYEAALACLALALVAILASAVWPGQTPALRLVHLHLNTLGFIGLTAVGTLAVLLPTAVGRPDAERGRWLRRALPWSVAGVLLVAVGAAGFRPLAWLGAVLWVFPLAWLGVRWLRLYRAEILALHGAAPLLAAALAGLILSLFFGAIAGRFPAIAPAAAFVAGFLLPLVSGAASQLLPAWLRPGGQTAWHAARRTRLGRYGGLRAALFLVSGCAAGLGAAWGLPRGTATLLWFILQAAVALAQAFRKEKPP